MSARDLLPGFEPSDPDPEYDAFMATVDRLFLAAGIGPGDEGKANAILEFAVKVAPSQAVSSLGIRCLKLLLQPTRGGALPEMAFAICDFAEEHFAKHLATFGMGASIAMVRAEAELIREERRAAAPESDTFVFTGRADVDAAALVRAIELGSKATMLRAEFQSYLKAMSVALSDRAAVDVD